MLKRVARGRHCGPLQQQVLRGGGFGFERGDADPPAFAPGWRVAYQDVTTPIDQRTANSLRNQRLHRPVNRIPDGDPPQVQLHPGHFQLGDGPIGPQLQVPVSHPLPRLGQHVGGGQLTAAAGSPPQPGERPHRGVERPVGLARQVDGGPQHPVQVVTEGHFGPRTRGFAQQREFAVLLVIAQDVVELLDPLEGPAGGPVCGVRIGGIYYDAERHPHQLLVEFVALFSRGAGRLGKHHTHQPDDESVRHGAIPLTDAERCRAES